MRLFKNSLTNITKRRYAKVHDVQIKFVQEKEAQTTMEKNVHNQPLTLHSTRPLTGFLRTGYCEAPRSDTGNHSVAGIMTNEFLDFSAARGNDLRQAGLSDGCKWCLCVARWKEAFDARSGDNDRKVPKVVLSATNKRALEGATMEELRKFAAEEKN
ncbi:uncharacterized protein N0V89_002691 [Didymosphaeria variabile]|uniref:Uncharacterized protein n=1 Tax=Didymosphaeria variabile TaxID=1932322 RepID=A0A9W8XV97_9PLEO|nr:uncharacterized protein N0V89_002691 [Didymosphaeria variabile]KAJ4358112.1 hypothetical protein N0V89_002691 [Didymosphaeria variabile]